MNKTPLERTRANLLVPVEDRIKDYQDFCSAMHPWVVMFQNRSESKNGPSDDQSSRPTDPISVAKRLGEMLLKVVPESELVVGGSIALMASGMLPRLTKDLDANVRVPGAFCSDEVSLRELGESLKQAPDVEIVGTQMECRPVRIIRMRIGRMPIDLYVNAREEPFPLYERMFAAAQKVAGISYCPPEVIIVFKLVGMREGSQREHKDKNDLVQIAMACPHFDDEFIETEVKRLKPVDAEASLSLWRLLQKQGRASESDASCPD